MRSRNSGVFPGGIPTRECSANQACWCNSLHAQKEELERRVAEMNARLLAVRRNGMSRRPRCLQTPSTSLARKLLKQKLNQFKPKLTPAEWAIFPVPEARESWSFVETVAR